MKFPSNLFLLTPLLAFNINTGLENTNILTYDKGSSLLDFNRLRLTSTLEHQDNEALRAKIEIDNQNIYSYKEESIVNKTGIYRAYLEYAGQKHFLTMGRQRVPFGVGRIWNPVDIFNPIDSFSLEPTERPGTEALRYEYAINDLSNFDLTLSRDKDAARIKGFLGAVDLALLGVTDRNQDRNIVGYEIEGNLLKSGISLRSEGGSFYNRKSGERYSEFIAGADYGLPNSLTILLEYKYNDESKIDYWGTNLTYQSGPLTNLGLLNIVNLDDQSSFTSPSIQYSLSDEMTLSGGAQLYNGEESDEFGGIPDRFYLNFFVHF